MEDQKRKEIMENYLHLTGITYTYQDAFNSYETHLKFLDILSGIDNTSSIGTNEFLIKAEPIVRQQLLDKFFNVVFHLLLYFGNGDNHIPGLRQNKIDFDKLYYKFKNEGEGGNLYSKTLYTFLREKFDEKFYKFLCGRILVLED